MEFHFAQDRAATYLEQLANDLIDDGRAYDADACHEAFDSVNTAKYIYELEMIFNKIGLNLEDLF